MSRGGEAAGDMDGTEPEPEAEVEASVLGGGLKQLDARGWSCWGEAPSPWSLLDARFPTGHSVKSVVEPAEFLLGLDCLFLLLGLLGSLLC